MDLFYWVGDIAFYVFSIRIYISVIECFKKKLSFGTST